MSPYATLRGRVVGADGQPAADVEVAVRFLQSHSALFTTKSDQDGSFLFDRMTSGAYYLLAKPKPGAPAGEGMALAPTYFLSAERRAQAERVVVRNGVESSGYEIRLQALPVYHLSGMVVDESGKPEPRAQVRLISTVEGMSAPPESPERHVIISGTLKRETEIGAAAGPDAAFDFSTVRPGPWRVLATYQPRRTEESSPPEGGAVSVTVADHDIGNLQIRVEPAASCC